MLRVVSKCAGCAAVAGEPAELRKRGAVSPRVLSCHPTEEIAASSAVCVRRVTWPGLPLSATLAAGQTQQAAESAPASRSVGASGGWPMLLLLRSLLPVLVSLVSACQPLVNLLQAARTRLARADPRSHSSLHPAPVDVWSVPSSPVLSSSAGAPSSCSDGVGTGMAARVSGPSGRDQSDSAPAMGSHAVHDRGKEWCGRLACQATARRINGCDLSSDACDADGTNAIANRAPPQSMDLTHRCAHGWVCRQT